MVVVVVALVDVVVAKKYVFNHFIDIPSLRERIALRLTPPMEDSYFTNLLKVI